MLPRRQEQRKHLRRPMNRTAEVIFGANEPPVHCVIWDMSDGGARLAIRRPLSNLPRTFTLVLFKDTSIQRNCKVMWTNGRYVGVKFVSEWYGTIKSGRHPNARERHRSLNADQLRNRYAAGTGLRGTAGCRYCRCVTLLHETTDD